MFAHKEKIVLGVFAVLASLSSGNAQTLPAGSEPGRVENRFKQPAPVRAKSREIRGLESTMAPSEAAKVKLQIQEIELTNSTVFSKEELSELYRDIVGKDVTLSVVFELAARITQAYGEKGYLLSRVIVPPQKLSPEGAKIILKAVEGYVDEVIWPEELERYYDFFTEYGEKIKASRPLNVKTLERYLLLASGLPGLKFKSNLKASETNSAASTLYLTVEKEPYSAQLSADNHGTEGSGPYQSTISGAANNVSGFHERWSGGYTVAGPSEDHQPELHYVNFGYEQTLNSEGLKFSLSGNSSRGNPGTAALTALEFKARSLNLSAALVYPFIRSRSKNLTGTITFDYKDSKSTNIGGIASEDRLRILRAELAYDNADKRNGTNQAVLSISHGIDGLGSTANNNPNASRAQGRVDFLKTTLTLSRTQKLDNNFSLFATVFGQWTPHSLLSSQECGYGGRQYGRGFDSSLITGDRCVLASAELRHNTSLNAEWQGKLDYAQTYSFIDHGRIWNIDAPLGTAERDEGTSGGVGIRFGKNNFNADLALTRTLAVPESTPNQENWRGWFRLSQKF